ncbi:amino acid ABC transporter substrate-binding protein [Peptostreptococcus canis]|uniref:Transporter substrate-binding domain-containing protein n=1 Tax=Peptostreptococcus canis TaxID=1159213 RepID=A0ABR6TKH3_9FIRM|nr:amino acid ABC transporter substrate-binding protein [Peptostreptococcus canis]MBC2575738.1 transporter substrate-binding domain-containing protein [Peptostreptococcus canis]MBP1998147.1 polar amino acid transport system substrate-binding protein [Peptostreptococcus canis]
MKRGLLKKLSIIGMGIVLMAGLSACSDSGKKANDTNSSKTVIVGLDNTFVPMGFLDDNNELVGFDIDIAKEAFKRAGYTPQFENIEWSLKEQSLNNKNVDCLWNGYSITEERKKKVDFSKPYFDNKQIIVTMSNNDFKSKNDLKDQAVGTQAASSGLDAIEADKDFINMIKDKQPSTYDTYDKALRDLEIGRIKAVVGDEVLLKYYIKQKGEDKYKVLEGDLGSEQYGVGFRKEDKELRENVDKALDEMKADGTFDKIKSKWFN